MDETKNTTNVALKIARIMADMPAIEKGKVQFGNTKYDAYGIDQITAVLRPLMAEYGLALVPEITNVYTDSKNTFVMMTMRLIDADSNECITSGWAQPLGTGKGVSKDMGEAISYAIKNFLMRTFMISPVGDYELDKEPPGDNALSLQPSPQQPQSQNQSVDNVNNVRQAIHQDNDVKARYTDNGNVNNFAIAGAMNQIGDDNALNRLGFDHVKNHMLTRERKNAE